MATISTMKLTPRSQEGTDIVALIEEIRDEASRPAQAGEIDGLCPTSMTNKEPLARLVNLIQNVWKLLGACGCWWRCDFSGSAR